MYVIGTYLSTFASLILITRFILKSMDKICHAQNSNQSVKHHWRSRENEIMGSAANGNCLGMLELLAQYDDFLKQHIQKHANLGCGHTNYLSSTICEELVQLM